MPHHQGILTPSSPLRHLVFPASVRLPQREPRNPEYREDWQRPFKGSCLEKICHLYLSWICFAQRRDGLPAVGMVGDAEVTGSGILNACWRFRFLADRIEVQAEKTCM